MWLKIILLFVGLIVFEPTVASAYYIDYNKIGDRLSLYGDTTVAENAMVFVEDIDVIGTVTLDNRGSVYGDIHIGTDSTLYFKNPGEFIGDIFADEHGARLVQVVSQYQDMNALSANVAYDVLVHNAERLSLNDVLNFGATADKIILSDSIVVINSNSDVALMRMANPEILIRGRVGIDIENADDIMYDVPLISNLSVDGSVYVYADNINPIYDVDGLIKNGDLYAVMVRRTDYGNIFGDDTGCFLDLLRLKNPNDSLLMALDSASDMTDIRHILAKSARMNPIKMMRPIQMLNLSETMNFAYTVGDSFVAVRPMVLAADDFIVGVTDIMGGLRITDNIMINVSAYSGMVFADTDLDQYDVYLYGVKAGIDYAGKSVFANVVVGTTIADFCADYIFDGANAVDTAHGRSFYAAADAGYKYSATPNLDIASFVGFAMNSAYVFDDATHVARPHFGGGVDYHTNVMGIAYDVGLRGRAHSGGGIDAGINVGFVSVFDGLGGGAYLGITRDDSGRAYQASISIKQLF